MAKLCVIDSKYVSDQEIELVMKERKWFSLSGDSMTVKDHRGDTHFKIDPSFFAKKERRELQDADGNTIACAQKVDGKWTLYSGDSYSPRSAVAEIMAEWMSSNNLKVKLFGDDQPAIEIDGDFKAKTWQVQKDQWLSDPVLAKIRRDSSKTDPEDPQTYFIWCESGIDLAFVVLLAMVVDEKAEDGAESD